MLRIILFYVFTFSTIVICAQEAMIYGQVVDSENDQSIAGVNVYNQDNLGVSTDAEGRFKLKLPLGEHRIKFSFIGYQSTIREIELGADGMEINIRLELNKELLDMVVISAGKFEQSISDVTVSMEVIQPKIIQERNTTTLEDMLQIVPGVTIVDNEPQIRSGSGFSFGAGSRVQILIDDMPILSGDAGRPSWSYLPIENLEQMEIIKGASSVLYGSSALSGVINLRTTYPKEKPITEFNVFSGVYTNPGIEESVWWNENNPLIGGFSFLHSRKINTLDLVLSGNFYGDQGFIGPEIIDPSDSLFYPEQVSRNGFDNRGRISVNLRKNFKNNPNIKVGINGNYFISKSATTLLWLNSDTGLYRPYPGSLTYTDQRAFHVDPYIEYYGSIGSKHSLKSRIYSLDNENTNDQSNFSDVWFNEYQYSQNFNQLGIQSFNSTFGAVYEYTTAESQLFSGNEGNNGSSEARKIAFYLQLDKKFFDDKLSVSVGARNESFELNDDSETATILRSGMNYQIAKASFLRASYGEGFRFPSIGEKFIQTRVSSLVIYPNIDLQSERSWNLEVGIKQGFKISDLSGFFDLALFQQEFDRFIEFTFGQWGGPQDPVLGLGFRSLNTGEARVRGMESTIIANLEKQKTSIDFMLGYTYTEPITLTPEQAYIEYTSSSLPDPTFINTSSDPSNNILKYRMQHSVRGDISVDLSKLHFGISGRYNSFMQNIDKIFEDLDSDPTLPSSLKIETGLTEWRRENNKGDAIFDVRVGYHLTENSKISLIINNALNRSYAIRPLVVEAPRLMQIQFNSSIK